MYYDVVMCYISNSKNKSLSKYQLSAIESKK